MIQAHSFKVGQRIAWSILSDDLMTITGEIIALTYGDLEMRDTLLPESSIEKVLSEPSYQILIDSEIPPDGSYGVMERNERCFRFIPESHLIEDGVKAL